MIKPKIRVGSGVFVGLGVSWGVNLAYGIDEGEEKRALERKNNRSCDGDDASCTERTDRGVLKEKGIKNQSAKAN
ncbi:hypothetical protein [Okeania sp. SIO2C2]|uniref:hypothetical protein n=1 Tax=Okeania sp. SIO2C2 TaxID=2607787 RepID=UPI002579BCE2|nr:hypothetical protein [Okeania sp. SIO2C2]